MIDFAYARADTWPPPSPRLADDHATVLAGGTELLNWVRLGIAAPERVVDIGGLDELRGISAATGVGDTLRIGALATLNEIGEHPLVVAHAGALASACLQAASAQIRNRATLGGNVLQRTRCAYFRAEEPVPWPCNRRAPGSGCAALAGLHERHAIFGWTEECVAVQPSDPAVALAALDAMVDVVGPAGPRTHPDDRVPPHPAGGGPAARRGSSPRRADRRLPHPDRARTGRPTSRSANAPPTSTRSSRRRRRRGCRRRDRDGAGGARIGRGQAVAAAATAATASRSPGRRCSRSSSAAWPTPSRCRTTGSR